MKPLTQAENYLMKDQLHVNGHFMEHLLWAIKKADVQNRAKLALGFPDLVEVVQRFKNEDGYFQDLCARWNEANPDQKVNP